jgi:hypothetical protein
MSERCRWTLKIVGTLLALLILINGLGTPKTGCQFTCSMAANRIVGVQTRVANGCEQHRENLAVGTLAMLHRGATSTARWSDG